LPFLLRSGCILAADGRKKPYRTALNAFESPYFDWKIGQGGSRPSVSA